MKRNIINYLSFRIIGHSKPSVIQSESGDVLLNEAKNLGNIHFMLPRFFVTAFL